MSNEISLQWQWPAQRQATRSAHGKVMSITPSKKGFANLLNHPSMAGALPDPSTIRVCVDGAPCEAGKGQILTVEAPGPEAKKISVGDTVVLDLLDGNICIGIKAK